MSESLSQALGLTLLGMGMTFGAIVVLILFMYLMTYLTNQTTMAAPMSTQAGHERAANVGEEMTEVRYENEAGVPQDMRRRRRAAAAAVAVALALRERVSDVKPVAGAERDAAWDTYMRTRHLSQRMRYESKKRL